MDIKLTLKLDNEVIERAKIYARGKNTSLSKLIESYLKFLTSNNTSELNEPTPLVKSISGINQSSKTADTKESYKKHISKKYTK